MHDNERSIFTALDQCSLHGLAAMRFHDPFLGRQMVSIVCSGAKTSVATRHGSGPVGLEMKKAATSTRSRARNLKCAHCILHSWVAWVTFGRYLNMLKAPLVHRGDE